MDGLYWDFGVLGARDGHCGVLVARDRHCCGAGARGLIRRKYDYSEECLLISL